MPKIEKIGKALAVLAVLLLAGCNDDKPRETVMPPITTTIGELRDLFEGTTLEITNEITVEGRVTTHDRNANFYRTFCIESDGAALEIMAGLDHLHNDYPEGCRVAVRLQGWALGESRGVLQAGRMPAAGSGYATDYLASRAALDRMVVRDGNTPLKPLEPTPCKIGELTPRMCGTLIRIEGMHYAPVSVALSGWGGYKRFANGQGEHIHTYVREYADFAEDDIPAGRGSLTGILQYDDDKGYILKIRDANDLIRYPREHLSQETEQSESI